VRCPRRDRLPASRDLARQRGARVVLEDVTPMLHHGRGCDRRVTPLGSQGRLDQRVQARTTIRVAGVSSSPLAHTLVTASGARARPAGTHHHHATGPDPCRASEAFAIGYMVRLRRHRRSPADPGRRTCRDAGWASPVRHLARPGRPGSAGRRRSRSYAGPGSAGSWRGCFVHLCFLMSRQDPPLWSSGGRSAS
jgi:hypothetical protein